jgi:hypothetical protein
MTSFALQFIAVGVTAAVWAYIGWKMGRASLREQLRRYVCFKNIPGTGRHTVINGKCVECGQRVV